MIFETLTPYIYYLLLLAVCMTASRYGSRDEIIGVAIMLSASVLTTISSQYLGTDWTGLFTFIFCVDAASFLAFFSLSLSSERFWPLWVTAFQSVSVLIHFAATVAPELAPRALATGAAFWAWPMIAMLALGILEGRSVGIQSDDVAH